MAQADSLGSEALLQASSDCKLRLVRLLVDGGTLVNVRNDNQETPLILACKSESEEKERVVEFLIKHRVKMNLQDVNGQTALMHACLSNCSDDLLRMLVNAKANPWLKDEKKNTAFDYAIAAGNIGAVKLMIQACREGKFLSKPGSFNMEMKRLEDRLDQMPETRKCSWPLMGPRSQANNKEKKVSHQTELLAVVDEDDEIESPARERRRKKSICHFDPINIEPDKNERAGETTDSPAKSLQKGSLYTSGRSSSEDERISLHFSDSDSSSFDRSSAHFSSLERLLKLRDTSSVESNESLNIQTSQQTVLKCEAAWNPDKDTAAHDDTKEEKYAFNQNQFEFDADVKLADNNKYDARLFCPGIQKQSETKVNDKRTVGSIESPLLPVASRRKTLGSLAAGKYDVMKSGDMTKSAGNDSGTKRRVTVSTMESYSPAPPPTRETHFDSSSPEVKLSRKKIRPPEVELPAKINVHSEKYLVARIRSSPDTARTRKLEASKTDFLRPINLPIISKPDEMDDEEGRKVIKSTTIEKTTVRRTLSDSMCQGRRRINAITTGSDNRLSVSRNDIPFLLDEHSIGACVDSFAAQMQTDYRQRSASSPLTVAIISTPPPERKNTFLFTYCDVTKTTSRDATRNRGPRTKLSGDLPDINSPARSRSPCNMESFKYELQVSDHISMQRLSMPSSPEILSPVSPGCQSCLSKSNSGSYTHLPEVMSGTTGSPKEKGAAFLPPLKISLKPNDAEEGYFSCSPSPMDLESPNRSNEKSRYSFKPLSPRLTNRPVRNLLP